MQNHYAISRFNRTSELQTSDTDKHRGTLNTHKVLRDIGSGRNDSTIPVHVSTHKGTLCSGYSAPQTQQWKGSREQGSTQWKKFPFRRDVDVAKQILLLEPKRQIHLCGSKLLHVSGLFFLRWNFLQKNWNARSFTSWHACSFASRYMFSCVLCTIWIWMVWQGFPWFSKSRSCETRHRKKNLRQKLRHSWWNFVIIFHAWMPAFFWFWFRQRTVLFVAIEHIGTATQSGDAGKLFCLDSVWRPAGGT